MALTEINFDGIVGPSHNYAGLSLGNLAATAHAGAVSYPRAAALQGLEKMRANRALGLEQGFLLPLPRPNQAFLAALGEPDDPALVATGHLAAFRCCYGQVAERDGAVMLDPESAATLGVAPGDTVWWIGR